MPTVNDVADGTGQEDRQQKIQTTNDLNSDFDENFESISDVDREPLNGGERKHSNWKDRREMRARTELMPRLEDGAD